MRDTLGVLLAGGAGERLFPLTRDRAKPAVPFGGHYRIIDITLSNCINSGLRKVYILTQYKALSLNRHVREVRLFEQGTIFTGTADQVVESPSLSLGLTGERLGDSTT